jgi:hypothetical protein
MDRNDTDTMPDEIDEGCSPSASAAPTLPADPADAQTLRHLAVLEKLRDSGADVAEAMRLRVIFAAGEGKTDDKAAKSFALAAKTVQQVILLHQEITGELKRRRRTRLAERMGQAKRIVGGAIERKNAGETPGQTRGERQLQRVKLDDLFDRKELFEGLSVAEIVERACRLFGVTPDPTLRWPDWAEIRGETAPEQPQSASQTAAPPSRPKPTVPARFSGASSLGLDGRIPPDRGFQDRRERAPP